MIILTGQTPSHKNSKIMSVNSRTGKFFPRNNQGFVNWINGATLEAKNQSKKMIANPVEIEIVFFVCNKTKRDLDNMASSVLDVLTPATEKKKYGAGVITGDDIFVVRGIHAIFGGIDRDNPRAEIEICELPSELRNIKGMHED